MSQWTLQGKRALISGGTKGIGLAAVCEFVELGAEVFLFARHAEEVEQTVDRFRSEGFSVFGFAADAALEEDRRKILQRVGDQFGRLDVLVNNVGMNIRKPFAEYTSEEYRRIFETNIFSALSLTQAALPLLQKGHRPSVVNVASVAAMVDVRSGPPYGMTKAALLQMTRHLAVEWAPLGIRVNAVSPWYTRTPLAEPVLQQPDRLEKILNRTPAGRIAEPGEVSGAIAFLAMDKASYITGQNIVTDGGMTVSGL